MPSLVERVSNIIHNLRLTGTPFTILDISNAVKQDGNGFVTHAEVRDIAKPILKLMNSVDDGTYEQYFSETIDVNTPNGLATAILYYPFGTDPSEYDSRNSVALPPTSQTVSTPVPATVTTNPAVVITPKSVQQQTTQPPAFMLKAISYASIKVRSDGCIQIPKELITSAFENSNFDRVDVIIHPNSMSLERGYERDIETPDFRISRNQLKDSNLGGKTHVWACAFSDKIVICAE